jgi:hypothetical protein
MSSHPPVLRKHYKQRAAVTAFYMGGPIDLGSDGEPLLRGRCWRFYFFSEVVARCISGFHLRQ